MKNTQVVFTNKARCRDCYRCVRVCPVKAIQMRDNQAFVVEEKCIMCGTCVRQCPQQAKVFRNDLEEAKIIVKENPVVAASIAPSFAAVFSNWQVNSFASALRKLGFSYVAETAVGAYYISQKSGEIVEANPDKNHFSTACPVFVKYVEIYQPQAIENLVPVVSPMIAHSKIIKEKLGGKAKVIFIGPCIAKKGEIQRPEYKGIVDCALTFAELKQWFEQEKIDLNNCEQSSFDDVVPGKARYFPLAGGEIKTREKSSDMLEPKIVSISGFDDINEALKNWTSDGQGIFIEPLFCSNGCINGPATDCAENLFERRKRIISYAVNKNEKADSSVTLELSAGFNPQIIKEIEVTEEQIRAQLEKTGKLNPQDQLNCGACGYPSCREKAIAVIRGMAEEQMCIPYMRRLAEQRTDRIIETSPNGIVILDDKLNVMSMNPAFKKFFFCTDAQYGKRISSLMDPEPFEILLNSDMKFNEQTVTHEKYNIICHQIMYCLREENQVVGIFVNITNSQLTKEKLDQLRVQTISQARELYDNQLEMAQKIAQFLGESTAKGERLVANLMQLAEDESQRKQKRRE
ncbi:MAG: 4Fe-4S binding protein [Planctomycetaceae bacterium]|nr:4Fe-4S binding protein [Planctomycetaceae bacterium]